MSQDTIADELLRSGYDRWLRLEEAKADISEDLKQLFIELKGNGLDTKAVRVSFRRVRDAGSTEVAEQEALVDLYVASLTRDPRVRVRENIEEFSADDTPEVAPPIDRAARRRHRFSESMEDAVELSAEAVADGLISPEAHAETVRLSSALANKFGDGPLHDAETGEILDHEIHGSSSINDEAFSTAAPQGEAVHSQGTGAETLAGREERSEGQAASADLPTLSPETANEMDRADKIGFSDGIEAAGNAREAIPASPEDGSVSHAGAGEIPATPSHADLTDKTREASASPAPLARLKTTDEVADDMGLPPEAHPGCRKPKICGRFSHKGLCAICRGEDREAA